MNNIKKVLSAWMLVACVLPVAAQYPVIPDSVKARGAKQEAEFERKSDAAWEKALPTVLEEAKKGRPYKPWASKPEDLIKSNIPAFPGAEGGGMYTPGDRSYFAGRFRSRNITRSLRNGRCTYYCIQCSGSDSFEKPD